VRVLAIDTSSEIGAVALVEDGELRASIQARVQAQHGETLLPHVERVLAIAEAASAEQAEQEDEGTEGEDEKEEEEDGEEEEEAEEEVEEEDVPQVHEEEEVEEEVDEIKIPVRKVKKCEGQSEGKGQGRGKAQGRSEGTEGRGQGKEGRRQGAQGEEGSGRWPAAHQTRRLGEPGAADDDAKVEAQQARGDIGGAPREGLSKNKFGNGCLWISLPPSSAENCRPAKFANSIQ